MVKIEMKFNREALRKRQQRIRQQGRQIVIMHALGAAAALYQVYPVGPDHKDGTPHTRDTFKVLVDGSVIAESGSFWNTTALGTRITEESFQVAFRAAGAAFFVEFGTIFMEARPVIRQEIKVAQANITNDLRHLNLNGPI